MVLKRKPPLLLVFGAALLFIGGGALALWGLTRRGSLGRGVPIGVNAIPEDAVMVLALSTDEAQWRRLRQFGTPETQAQFDQVLAQWRDRLLTDQGLNFRDDIQPWVGSEITLALLPPNEAAPELPATLPDPAIAFEDNMVMLVPIADAGRAQSNLGDRLGASPPGEEAPYRGITLQQLEGEGDTPLYGAVLNPELAILSPQLSALKRSIDAYRGGSGLVERPGFSRAFEQLADSRPVARFYVNMPTAVETLAAASEPPLPASRLQALQSARGLAGVVTVRNRGLHLQSVSWLEPGGPTFATGNKGDQMSQRLPHSTLLMTSGGDFQQFWEDWQGGQQLTALLPFRPDELALGLQAMTGLSVEDDWLPWMAGEFTVGFLPPPEEDAPVPGEESEALEEAPSRLNPALVLMVKASDRAAATATLERLDQVLATRYRFSRQEADVRGVPVTRWTSPFGALTLSYGWLEGDVVFFSFGEGLDELVAPRPSRALAEHNLFQVTTGDAPRPNNGYFFINLADLDTAQNSLLLPPLPTAGLLSADAIEAIGVTATVLGDRQVRYDLMAALRRGDRPGPLPQAEAEPVEVEAEEVGPEPGETEGESPETPPETPPE